MKKILFMVVAAMIAVGAFAQQTTKMIRVYQGNTIVFEQEYNSVDSVVFVDVNTSSEQIYDDGILPGAFSVGENTQIHFSQGNLQYQASTQTWRFAENQYDTIGALNANISPTYEGWIDLFGWGTGNNPTISSTDYNDYSSFTDWGVNAISNGGNETNQWRTLTKDEWVYLFYTRTNAASLFGLGSVNGINGTIILPDNWSTPQGVSFTPSTSKGLTDQGTFYADINDDHFDDNTYTAEQWSEMEQSGAVFLSTAGYRIGLDMYNVGLRGGCWSATPNNESEAYFMYFGVDGLNPESFTNRYRGRSVRLVR